MKTCLRCLEDHNKLTQAKILAPILHSILYKMVSRLDLSKGGIIPLETCLQLHIVVCGFITNYLPTRSRSFDF